MTTISRALVDPHGRPYQDAVGEDSSGNKYVLITNSSGQLEVALISNTGVDIGDVDILSIAAGNNRIGTVSGVLKEVRTVKAIDASIGAYAVGDVVNDDDCSTTATYWTFTEVARANGAAGYIVGAILVNETENQAVQYDLFLFNAAPTGELTDNSANTNPIVADRSKYIGKIEFPISVAKGATVMTVAQATPSTYGNLPLPFKCGAAVDDIYGVLVTNTIYTQTATDDIEIILLIEQY